MDGWAVVWLVEVEVAAAGPPVVDHGRLTSIREGSAVRGCPSVARGWEVTPWAPELVVVAVLDLSCSRDLDQLGNIVFSDSLLVS